MTAARRRAAPRRTRGGRRARGHAGHIDGPADGRGLADRRPGHALDRARRHDDRPGARRTEERRHDPRDDGGPRLADDARHGLAGPERPVHVQPRSGLRRHRRLPLSRLRWTPADEHDHGHDHGQQRGPGRRGRPRVRQRRSQGGGRGAGRPRERRGRRRRSPPGEAGLRAHPRRAELPRERQLRLHGRARLRRRRCLHLRRDRRDRRLGGDRGHR